MYCISDIYDWINDANSLIESILYGCKENKDKGCCNENYITADILRSIVKSHRKINWLDKKKYTLWDCYKLNGNKETSYGDIAVIVRIYISDDDYIEGVAFYEAKTQILKNGIMTFSSIDDEQIKRVSEKTSASNFVFYSLGNNEEYPSANYMPTALLSSLLSKESGESKVTKRDVYKYGKSWVYGLADNFIGFGLDFDYHNVNLIKNSFNFLNEESPSIVIDLRVTDKIIEVDKLPIHSDYISLFSLNSFNKLESKLNHSE